jgi:methionyl-tRNA formyltransferase
MVNVHASLLPRYRGAAPIHRAVMAGDSETGVTIMRVVQALDAGPMLATVRRPIGTDETSQDVERDLARLGADLLVETLDGVGRIPEVAQEDSEATYAPRLTKDDGVIDWTWPAERIHNAIRGLHPWPHAFTFLGVDRVILLRSQHRPVGAVPQGAPGAIVPAQEGFNVVTGSGTVRILELQLEGRRPVTAREFVAGHRLASGARFAAAP